MTLNENTKLLGIALFEVPGGATHDRVVAPDLTAKLVHVDLIAPYVHAVAAALSSVWLARGDDPTATRITGVGDALYLVEVLRDLTIAVLVDAQCGVAVDPQTALPPTFPGRVESSQKYWLTSTNDDPGVPKRWDCVATPIAVWSAHAETDAYFVEYVES